MRKKLLSLLGAALLSAVGTPAWAQLPGTAVGLPAMVPPAAAASQPPADPGCLDGHCDEGHGYFTAGGGLYFITPYFTSNPAFVTSKPVGPISNVEHQQDFRQRMSAAPLAWLGYTFENGWGVRVRWFDFDAGTQSSFTGDGVTAISGPGTGTFVTPSKGDVFTATNNMHLYAIDFEATNNWVFGRWSVLGSAGVRYAHVTQNYSAQVPAATISFPATPAGTLTGDHGFNGAGPTMSFEVRRQVFNSCFYLYGMARGSVLFGASRANASFPTSEPQDGPTLFGSNNLSSNSTIVVPVGELEVGGEVAQTFGRVRVFAQLALVGQVWWGLGTATQAMPLDYDNVTTPYSNLGFLGGVARFGVSF